MPKNYSTILAHGLTHDEFKCQCTHKDCNHTLVNQMFREQWEKFRSAWNAPLTINSGFRCQKHNDDVGGVPHSRHSMGMAVDVSLKGLSINDRADIIHLANTFFDYVRVYPTLEFIHMHVEPEQHR